MYSGYEAYYCRDVEWDGCSVSCLEYYRGVCSRGFFFMLSVDPLLVLLKQIEDMSSGTVRVCADDIGASPGAFYYLPIIERVFHRCRGLLGLIPKPRKCVMILTVTIASIPNVAALRHWLNAICARWANPQITNAGKYLGLVMGAHGSKSQGKEPLQKFKQRVLETKAEAPPLVLAASRYASRAKSTDCSHSLSSASLELWVVRKILVIPLSLDVEAAHGSESCAEARIDRA